MVSLVRPIVTVSFVCILCANARATPAAAPAPSLTTSLPPTEHANPRLKASYRLFSVGGLEGAPLWLDGAQLDAYALSRRWVRIGGELEGGGGRATLASTSATLRYGLVGVTAGVQYPARVTPFLEGRFVGGLLFGQLDGTLTVGMTSYSGSSVTTWIYGGGLETGIEVYVYRRAYLSGALGWMRSTWHGVDVAAMMQNPAGGMVYKDIVGDSVTLKLGFGI
jgi:hypothetical protein